MKKFLLLALLLFAVPAWADGPYPPPTITLGAPVQREGEIGWFVPVNISNWTGVSLTGLYSDEFGGGGNLVFYSPPGSTNPLRTVKDVGYNNYADYVADYWHSYPGGGYTGYTLWPSPSPGELHLNAYRRPSGPFAQSPASGTLVWVQVVGEGLLSLRNAPDTYGCYDACDYQPVYVGMAANTQAIPPPDWGGGGGGGQHEEGLGATLEGKPVTKKRVTWGTIKSICR